MEPTSQRKCDLHWREGEWTVSSPRCVLSCWHTVHYTSKYLFPKLPVKSTQDIRALRPPKNIIYQINIDLVCSCFNAHQRNTIFYRNFLCVRVGVWAVKWLGFTITFDNRLAGHILLWSLYFFPQWAVSFRAKVDVKPAEMQFCEKSSFHDIVIKPDRNCTGTQVKVQCCGRRNEDKKKTLLAQSEIIW